jgi:hypothetical protein
MPAAIAFNFEDFAQSYCQDNSLPEIAIFGDSR